MAIKVSGTITLRGNYEVELDMTEAEFDALSESKQNAEIESAIDWRNWVNNSYSDDIDVDDVEEVTK